MPPGDDIRFRSTALPGFPAAAVDSIGEDGSLTVNCIGLAAVSGGLPAHYAALLEERTRLKDFSLRDFLDTFNHRLVSLYYQAWQKYRFYCNYERTTEARSADDDVSASLFSLVGLGLPPLRKRASFDDQAVLFFAGHFARSTRSSHVLQAIVADYFDLPTEIEQFHGQWLRLEPDGLSKLLDDDSRPEASNCRLGVDVIVGERVWDVQSKFRIRLGPMPYERFCDFIPGGSGLRSLCEFVRLYVGVDLDFDVQPVLLKQEIPSCRLLSDDDEASNLGWNAWLPIADRAADADDAVFVYVV